MKWTAKAIKNWDVETQTSDGRWIPARPYAVNEPLLTKIKDAWMVLIGKYGALDWEDD